MFQTSRPVFPGLRNGHGKRRGIGEARQRSAVCARANARFFSVREARAAEGAARTPPHSRKTVTKKATRVSGCQFGSKMLMLPTRNVSLPAWKSRFHPTICLGTFVKCTCDIRMDTCFE